MLRHRRLAALSMLVVFCLSLIPVASQIPHVQARVGGGGGRGGGVPQPPQAVSVKDSAPVFGTGVAVGEAWVIYDSDENIYKMWYTQVTANVTAYDNLINSILGLSLGTLLDDIKNLRFRRIVENDAANVKAIIDYLAGLSVEQLQTLFAGTGSRIGYATSTNGTYWQLGRADALTGTVGAWDKYGVSAPTVIKNSPTSYEMWYTGANLDVAAVAAVLDDLVQLSAGDIGVLLGDIINLKIVDFFTHLIAARGFDYLFDFIVDVVNVFGGVNLAIGRAISTDGINWEKDTNPVFTRGSGNAWDKYGVGSASVLKTSPSSYEMWYTGFGADYSAVLDLVAATNVAQVESALMKMIPVAIGRATSTNGTGWIKDTNPVLTKGSGDVWDKYGVMDPCVLKVGSTYEMWYTGNKMVLSTLLNFIRGTSTLENSVVGGIHAAIGHASSSTGIGWTRDASNPVLTKGVGVDVWDKYGVGAPSVVAKGSTLEMWYTGVRSCLRTVIIDLLDGRGLRTALTNSNTMAAIGRATQTIKVTVPAGQTNYVVDASAIANTTITVSNTTAEVTITVTKYYTNPQPAAPLPGTALARYIDITVSNLTAIVWPMRVEQTYTDAEVAGLNESSLRMYHYRAGGWQQCSDSGVNTATNIVWANLRSDEVSGSKYGTFGAPSVAGGPGGAAPGTISLSGLTAVTSLFIDPNTGIFQGTVPVQLKTVDGKASLTIAVATRLRDARGFALTSFWASVVTAPQRPPAQTAIAAAYDFGPDGATFDKPITLTMTYDPATLPKGAKEGELYIAYWDGSQWQTLTSTVDTAARTVSAGVSHFTQFAVLSKLPPPTPVPTPTPTPTPVPKPVPTPTPTPTPPPPPPVPTPTPTPTPTPVAPPPPPPVNWPLIVGIIAGVIVVGVIVWLVVRRRAY